MLHSADDRSRFVAAGLDAGLAEQMLRMQFDAQGQAYAERFPEAIESVVLENGEPIGRLWVHRTVDEVRVLDIRIAPAHRGQGVGGRLLRDLQAEAAARGARVTLTVAVDNPGALRLYERLGFVEVDRTETDIVMEWTAA